MLSVCFDQEIFSLTIKSTVATSVMCVSCLPLEAVGMIRRNALQYNTIIQCNDNTIRDDMIEHSIEPWPLHPFSFYHALSLIIDYRKIEEKQKQTELKSISIYIHTYTNPAEKECLFHIKFSPLYCSFSENEKKKDLFIRHQGTITVNPSINRLVDGWVDLTSALPHSSTKKLPSSSIRQFILHSAP
jgi:hypothetical protein